MKSKLSTTFLVFIIILISSIYSAFSQFTGNEIAEGKEYWFGLPHCMKSSDEYVRWGVYPIELWISSKVDTKATVEALDGNLQPQTVSIRKNDITIISLPDNLENRESEIVRNYGVHIFADDPISVGVFVAYMWSGEAYRVIPVEWLGKEYFTLNMFQDYVKMHSGNMEYKPGQITICATENNTEVQYIPTVETEKGIKPGQIGRVSLNKGQTFAIKTKIFPALNQDWATDMSGTQIIASKPVAVISGHTKGCFPKYTGTMFGIKADFVRNMLVDMMWPVELLGKEYVSAPIKYLDRYVYHLVADDKGDIIRFVATKDNTIIYQMRQDGSSLMQISPVLKKGQWFDILNQEVAAYYKSNNKVLVGQYGKSWISNVPPVLTKPGDDPQNPSRNGQGMMFALSPIERWCSFASFRVPANMDNFLYLTFRTDDANKIVYDNQSITSRFGNAIKPINGTPFSYLVQNIASGNHYLEATDKNARFAGYAYGNWDGSKDGFAYGYPIGINYADDCNDSIFVVDNIDCGNIEGVVKAVDLQEDTTCAGIFSVIFRDSESANYHFNKDEDFEIGDTTYNFTIDIINPGDSALAVLNILSKSGKFIRREIKYVPEKIGVDITGIDYGLMIPPQTICKNFVIKNPGTAPMTVHNIYLKFGRSEFTINAQVPFTLQPNEEKIIEVCANATQVTNQAVRDSVVAVLTCYEQTLVGLQFRTGEPVVYIYDADWGKVPINQERMKNVEIKNTSNTDVDIYTIEWNDKVHFTRVERLNLPISIPAGESIEFSVYYKPDVADVQHTE
ncbi:MAG TPA: IgGFc-binding protein, partial [Candidatus Kapabacteria bacterium]|nr:IgGFc-binding protein [Candidatus Kapabacteria bacterium]